MSLTLFNTADRTLSLMQNSWATALNPLLSNPLLSGSLINIALINGVTTINHRLQRKQQGWFLVDIDGAALVHRSQPFNDLTLTLTSNAQVGAKIYVF